VPKPNKIQEHVRAVTFQFDPQSYISLNIGETKYEAFIRDLASACWKERIGLSLDGLANIIAFADHLHFSSWSKPVQVLGIHHKMAEALLPKLPQRPLN
jgi:hypothetical protein